ncbi:hypothetical protein RHGRI_030156 [Rhododendron griersonianum]|uniref:GTD-binding domain-containing protein n=1 Tax=Rhododendron griersonianum TaxID=479676 RepID=A0AAV6IQA9_9ERIC|nr:hypothetical protein RHGRI_030156 [Rhododendron griersonianum]
MAANKFATMLHRNTHKITVILVYAVLEWFLIFLLLLNSLFSFLISKFANYFGLKPPCLLCSRIDQILEPNNRNNAYTNLICESHATEISQLGFCPNHKRLAESQKLCKNCLPKNPKIVENSIEISRRNGLFKWVNEKRIANGVRNVKCSCCDGILSRKFHPSFLVFKPSWGTLGHSWRRDLTAEVIHEESNEGEVSDTSDCDCFLDQGGNDDEAKEDDDANTLQASCGEDGGAISLIDSSTMVPEAASHVVREVSEERVNGNLKQPGGEEEHDYRTLLGDDETKPATITGKKEFEALTGPEMSGTSSIDQGLQKIQKDCQGTNHHLSKISDLSGAEESWDGSFISEMESGDGSLTVEKLKSALQAEHNALTALYTELEEERSAAAIATSQTMAMITRLQEEKAAMQMEALQYQRMMEEQSEYDQEALQLLNELMLKREKEKQELEREVEVYRKRFFDYEAKEKTVMIRRRDGNAEDTDELSIDLNHESYNNTFTDGVLNFEEMGKDLSSLDDSLAGFEEERISILEELKSLEEKLFTLANNNNEELFFHNNGYGSPRENGGSNGYFGNSNGEDFSESNEMDSKGKNLLPLFDATAVVDGEGELDEDGIEENLVDSKIELVDKKLGIEEEVDHVYERLQALETDREFLKHCVSSLKKGDKGMDLLQEILEHLRDLRTVELRARSGCNSPLS